METEEGLRAAEAAAEEVRSEKASQGGVVAPVVSPSPVVVPEKKKKKRGRPRKYGPDGSLLLPLNPTPISTSAPAGGDFGKRGRGRPLDYAKKSQHGFELEPLGITT